MTVMPRLLECKAAISDSVLQAARQAIPAHVDSLLPLPECGAHNRPLLPLLVTLLDATRAVAGAVADNAWDHTTRLDQQLADELAAQARAIALDIDSAACAPAAE